MPNKFLVAKYLLLLGLLELAMEKPKSYRRYFSELFLS